MYISKYVFYKSVGVEAEPSIECKVCGTLIIMVKTLISQNSTEVGGHNCV